MIISDQHKYVFVQLPKTASTAIEKELLEYYGGQSILLKHDLYHKFLKKARPEQKSYLVFASVRNPMDIVASHYFNLLQENRLKKRTPEKHSFFRRLWGSYRTRSRFDFVHGGPGDFKTYFLRFYKAPYANWSIVDHKRFDFVIRYEHMQEDFSELLKRLDLVQVRPIPKANTTLNKTGSFLDLYTDPEVIQRAVNVFGPYFRDFGYEFPQEWSEYKESFWPSVTYPLYNAVRRFYWKYLR